MAASKRTLHDEPAHGSIFLASTAEASFRSPIPLDRSHWSWVFKESGIPTFKKPKAAFGSAFAPKSWLPQGLKRSPAGLEMVSHRRHSAGGRHPCRSRVLSRQKTLPLWQSLLRMSMVSISVLDPGKSSNCMEAFTEAFATTQTPAHEGWAQQSGHPKCQQCGSWLRRMWYGLENLCRQHYKEPSGQTSESVFCHRNLLTGVSRSKLAWMAKAAGATLVKSILSAHSSRSRFSTEGFGGPGDAQGAASASRRPDIRSNQPIEPSHPDQITRPSPFQSAA